MRLAGQEEERGQVADLVGPLAGPKRQKVLEREGWDKCCEDNYLTMTSGPRRGLEWYVTRMSVGLVLLLLPVAGSEASRRGEGLPVSFLP